MVWKSEEHENLGSLASSRAEIEACREWTPFLTALFDGEADEEGALQARRHLLVCERCARAWLDWNQTRNLLINHSAPPPPPNLLWRVRLACRLGHPKAATPDLNTRILSRTSRQKAKPAFATPFAFNTLRLNAPWFGAVAAGAFVLLLSRGTSLQAPPTDPGASSIEVREARSTADAMPRVRAKNEVELPVLASHVEADSQAKTTPPQMVKVAIQARSLGDSSLASLARARRERESLAPVSVRLASFSDDAPLPMLAPSRSTRREKTFARRLVFRVRSVHSPRRVARPVASFPRLAAPSVVLASVPVAPAVSEPSSSSFERGGRSGRVLLASFRAPLRISAPRALPITMEQTPAPDDSGLDELDSTVQEYRATLADDSDPNSDAG